jgi:hypothetical protein
VRALGIPAVEDRERRRLRPDRGADLERARDRFPGERGALQNPVRADPRGETPSQSTPGEHPQGPASPPLALVRGEIQPLDPQSEPDGTRRALADQEARRGLARPGARGRDVVRRAGEAGAAERRVQLGMGQPVRVVEGRPAHSRAPSAHVFLEGEPGPVRGGAAERRGGRVAQLEGGARGRGEKNAQERQRRDHARRPHRSTTVSARFPLRAGSEPSGIVSARAT